MDDLLLLVEVLLPHLIYWTVRCDEILWSIILLLKPFEKLLLLSIISFFWTFFFLFRLFDRREEAFTDDFPSDHAMKSDVSEHTFLNEVFFILLSYLIF